MHTKGTLYLLPTPLDDTGSRDDAALYTLPSYAIELCHRLDYFIAERAKSARRFLKSTGLSQPISELHLVEITKRTPPEEWRQFLQPAEAGEDIGLLSEAGCPGIADPGARIVALAHERNIPVVPVVGPSSILLALIASGLNGQAFCFHGYLSPKRPQLKKELQRLEQEVHRTGSTQLFMETPYRNQQIVETVLQTLSPDLAFGIAADLTLPSQFIQTRPIKTWKQSPPPDLHKRPCIFLLGKMQR